MSQNDAWTLAGCMMRAWLGIADTKGHVVLWLPTGMVHNTFWTGSGPSRKVVRYLGCLHQVLSWALLGCAASESHALAEVSRVQQCATNIPAPLRSAHTLCVRIVQ